MYPLVAFHHGISTPHNSPELLTVQCSAIQCSADVTARAKKGWHNAVAHAGNYKKS